MDKKIGILGGGQLGRMLALACHPMGIEVSLVDEKASAPANDVAELGAYAYSDFEKIKNFFAEVDAITYEFENIPLDLLEKLSEDKSIFPPLNALKISRHRGEEKTFVSKLNIPTANFTVISGFSDLHPNVDNFQFPIIIKTCSEGYDGKGQFRFNDSSELIAFLETKPSEIGELIVEQFVKFDFEVSCLAVRGVSGECKFYPVSENHHEHGILSYTKAPSNLVSKELEAKAYSYTLKILEALNYVGVIAVEYFVRDQELIFNEYAPRVHNSGHWTIEGAMTSQFENHVRACLDLPLGSTESTGYCLMLNLLGTKGPIDKLLKTPNAFYHWYGKKRVTGKRKVGHVNLIYKSAEEREQVNLSAFQEQLKPQNV